MVIMISHIARPAGEYFVGKATLVANRIAEVIRTIAVNNTRIVLNRIFFIPRDIMPAAMGNKIERPASVDVICVTSYHAADLFAKFLVSFRHKNRAKKFLQLLNQIPFCISKMGFIYLDGMYQSSYTSDKYQV
jgi:hypothetical protein